MCLTLTNAGTIHHHTDPTGTTGSSARGYPPGPGGGVHPH